MAAGEHFFLQTGAAGLVAFRVPRRLLLPRAKSAGAGRGEILPFVPARNFIFGGDKFFFVQRPEYFFDKRCFKTQRHRQGLRIDTGDGPARTRDAGVVVQKDPDRQSVTATATRALSDHSRFRFVQYAVMNLIPAQSNLSPVVGRIMS